MAACAVNWCASDAKKFRALKCMRWTQLCRRPRLVQADGFLTPVECSLLRQLARPKLAPTAAEDWAGTGAHRQRSASGCWLPRRDTPAHAWASFGGPGTPAARLVGLIEARIARATGIPLDHGEPAQLLRYRRGEAYSLHPDFFDPADAANLRNGGQRVATFLVYLSTVDPAHGGATVFPRAVEERQGGCDGHTSVARQDRRAPGRVDDLGAREVLPIDSGRRGLRVAPVEGRAVWWRNTLEEGARGGGGVDVRSIHAGEPLGVGVGRGEKWLLSKWLRREPFRVAVDAF